MTEKRPGPIFGALGSALFGFLLFSFLPLLHKPDGCLPMSHYFDKHGFGPNSLASFYAAIDYFGWGLAIAFMVVSAVVFALFLWRNEDNPK